MVTMASADSALKNYYLGAVSQHIDTEKVCEYGRV